MSGIARCRFTDSASDVIGVAAAADRVAGNLEFYAIK
jgi:hypothetical protein